MKIYRAETGQQVDWNSSAAGQIHTLDDLKLEVERCTGVPAKSQILMTSFGTQVKQVHVNDVLKATGHEEYIIFCYDRHYLGALPEEISTLLDVEMPCLEPDIKPFDPSWRSKVTQLQSHNQKQSCEAYVSLFQGFAAHSENLTKAVSTHTQLAKRIVEEQKSQSMALNVAMTNLESHNNSVNKGIRSFSERAERELAKKIELMQAVDIDLEILRKVQIHEHILRQTPQRKSRLIDYVDDNHILRVKREARELCDRLSPEIHSLKVTSQRLKRLEQSLQAQITDDHDLQSLDTDLSEIQDSYTKMQILRDRIKRDLGRIYEKASNLLELPLDALLSGLSLEDIYDTSKSRDKIKHDYEPMPSVSSSQARRTIEAFRHLAETTQDDYIEKQHQYELRVRTKVQDLIRRKRQSIERFLEHMNVVSQLQSEIAAVAPRLESANKDLSDFKQKHGSHDLEIANEVLFAYGTLMIEIVRRKEYAITLGENANVLAGVLTQFHEHEEERRAHFRSNVEPSLPFRLQVNSDSAPCCEITTMNNDQNEPTISRKDIIAFISMLGQFYTSSKEQQFGQMPVNSRLIDNASKLVSSSSDRVASPLSRSHAYKTIDRDTREARFLDLLNNMNTQLDGLLPEFLKSIDNAFFTNFSDSTLKGYSGSNVLSPRKNKIGSMPYDTTAAGPSKLPNTTIISDLEDQIKIYEARILSLENALKFSSTVVATSSQHPTHAESRYRPDSNVSSTYSVLDDKSDNSDGASGQSATAEPKPQTNSRGDDKQTKLLLEQVEQLRNTSQRQQDVISDLRNKLAQEEQRWTDFTKESKKNESEKEDMRDKILELEQLLDEERQMYEDNRKSLLKEAQIKDNLADVRVANVEHEWHDKTATLQDELQTERERNEHVQKELDNLRKQHKIIEREKTDLQREYDELQVTAETRKAELDKLLKDVDDSEQARDEIKERLSQARDMVERAEWHWNDKSHSLDKLTKKHDTIRQAVADMLSQYTDKTIPDDEEVEIVDMLSGFKQSLDAFADQANEEHHQLLRLEQEHAQLSSRFNLVEEECEEWKELCVLLARRIEYIQRNILYELSTQLQLPVDQEEIVMLTQKVLPGDDETETDGQRVIAQSKYEIDAPTFVGRIRKKVRDAHDLTRRWQKEYREIKDKYNKIASNAHEKIAFRNFKVGDAALFLPTRNSTGKPWAAFNINAPHYFLRPSEGIANQMTTREWIVARITSITECVVDAQDPESNPYGLANGLCFYQLEVEPLRNSRRSQKRMRHPGSDERPSQQRMHSSVNLSESSPSYSISVAQQQASLAMSSIAHSYTASAVASSPPLDVERRHSAGYFPPPSPLARNASPDNPKN